MMKEIAIGLSIVIAAPAMAAANDLNFSWDTPSVTPEGYHLFMDDHGTPVKTDIPGDATTTSFPDPDDGKPHAFWVKAWRGAEVSGNSDVAVSTPDKLEPPETTSGFIITTTTVVTPNE